MEASGRLVLPHGATDTYTEPKVQRAVEPNLKFNTKFVDQN
jgi:hypothetical protein